MSAHTPGTWKVVRSPQGTMVFARTGKVAIVIHWPFSIKVKEANAHLIAAAPDMLEALRDVIERTDITSEPRKVVLAAIAKATGEPA